MYNKFNGFFIAPIEISGNYFSELNNTIKYEFYQNCMFERQTLENIFIAIRDGILQNRDFEGDPEVG